MLPFTSEVFFALFGEYNREIWPAQILAYVLGATAAALVLRPIAPGGRAIALVLVLFWGWTGIVYHGIYFAKINFAAPVFAALYIVQTIALLWTGVIRGGLTFRLRANAAGIFGTVTVLMAMLGYPLLAWLDGHSWPQVAVFGVAPCPVTLFTLGLLTMTAGKVRWHLAIIPLIWAAIGGSAALLLEMRADVMLWAAGIVFIPVAVWKNRSVGRAARA